MYIVLERIEGPDLHDHILAQPQGMLPEPQARASAAHVQRAWAACGLRAGSACAARVPCVCSACAVHVQRMCMRSASTRAEHTHMQCPRACPGRIQARRFFRHLVAALRHAHARGFLHCDVKPANVRLQLGPTEGELTAVLVSGDDSL